MVPFESSARLLHVRYGEKAFLEVPFFVAVVTRLRRPHPSFAPKISMRKQQELLKPSITKS